MNSIKLSVCMISYNHEPFITQAIEAVLMQKTNFRIELVIGEDCSTDQTREICKAYKEKYPNIIKLRLLDKNIGVMPNFIENLKTCSGKYIALCEGDDYWTSPKKLQKQVDFLEANEDYAICHHNMQVIYEDGRESHLSNSPDQKEVTTIEDLAKGNYIYTASCVYRNGLIKEFPDWFKNAPIGDYVLHMLNAQYGKIKFLPDVMGVYRVHKGGIWENKGLLYHIEKSVDLRDLMKNHFNPKINEILRRVQSNQCNYLIMQFQDNAEKSKYYSFKLIENEPYYISCINKKIKDCNHINKQVLSIFHLLGQSIIKPLYSLKKYFNKFIKTRSSII